MAYSPPTFDSERLTQAARSSQASYAGLVLTIGVVVSVVYSLGAQLPSGYVKLLMASSIIFGTVEIPRLRGVPDFVQLIEMTFTAVIAALFASEFGGADIETAAMIAIALLAGASLIVLWVSKTSPGSEDDEEVVE